MYSITMKKTPSTRSAVTMPTMFWWSRAASRRGSCSRSSSSPLWRWGTLIATFLSIQTSLARKTVPKPPEPRLERIWYLPTVCPSRNMRRARSIAPRDRVSPEVAPEHLGDGDRGDGRGLRAEDAGAEARGPKPAAVRRSTRRLVPAARRADQQEHRVRASGEPREGRRLAGWLRRAAEGRRRSAASSSSRVMVGATGGTTARPHCSAAPLATLSQRSWREPCSAGRAAASVRAVTTGQTSRHPELRRLLDHHLHAVALERGKGEHEAERRLRPRRRPRPRGEPTPPRGSPRRGWPRTRSRGRRRRGPRRRSAGAAPRGHGGRSARAGRAGRPERPRARGSGAILMRGA